MHRRWGVHRGIKAAGRREVNSMRRLFRYIRPYWRGALAAPLLMMVEVAADLAQPFLMARIIDLGIPGGDQELIIRTGFLMVAIALVGAAGGFGCMFYSSHVAQSFGCDLRHDLFGKIQTFSFAELDKFQNASLITRLTNDVVQMQNLVLMSLRILVRAPLLLVGGVIMAVAINPGLAWVLAAAAPLLFIVLTVLIRKAFPLFAKVQVRLDKVNSVVQENLRGIRVVKSFVRADYENGRFALANQELTGISKTANRTVGMVMPLMMLILHLTIAAVLWLGGIKVAAGTIQVGEVIAFTSYITQILFALMIMAFLLMSVSRAKASADRILEVMASPVGIADPGQPGSGKINAGRIEFQAVSFQYAGAQGDPVLRQISFTVRPGQTVGILGATGSGKSTLINLLPRFYDPTQGRILIDGQDIRDYRLSDLRAAIGMVPQDTVLFSGTVRQNLLWGKGDASDGDLAAAASIAQADEFIRRLPDGYDTVLGQRGVNLSGGQKQRLAIARALLKKPRILILDDSTSALDLGTESRLQQALKTELLQCTRLVIAQRITTVMEADRILVMEDGQIVAAGTHGDLLAGCPIYQEIYRSQVGEEAV